MYVTKMYSYTINENKGITIYRNGNVWSQVSHNTTASDKQNAFKTVQYLFDIGNTTLLESCESELLEYEALIKMIAQAVSELFPP